MTRWRLTAGEASCSTAIARSSSGSGSRAYPTVRGHSLMMMMTIAVAAV